MRCGNECRDVRWRRNHGEEAKTEYVPRGPERNGLQAVETSPLLS